MNRRTEKKALSRPINTMTPRQTDLYRRAWSKHTKRLIRRSRRESLAGWGTPGGDW